MNIWIIHRKSYSGLSEDDRIYYSKEEAIITYCKSLCHKHSDPNLMNIDAVWEYEQKQGLECIPAVLELR
jgi:hypothetical protein